MLLTRCTYLFLIRKRIDAAERLATELGVYETRADKEAYQVKCFNSVWECARKNVPFYKDWSERYSLPDEIGSLAELEKWPVLTKGDLRNIDSFVRLDVPEPKCRIMTGGSTGEPVRLPSWGDPWSGVSQIVGRKAYGIEPGDKTFLLWGHEHLYGTGFGRKINTLKRRVKDHLSNWTRVSAYDLSAQAMRKAYEVFAWDKPKFVIGFSPAVLAFVRNNKDRAGCVDSVRAVLCTAGPLTKEEKSEIEDFFGGIVCMEYGSVECGVMAYTRPSDGQYNVFWNTHLLQVRRDVCGECKNIVTRLTDCYVPLIRYDIGDYLDIDCSREEDNVRSVLEIRSVKGRPSEIINFKCGVTFFGALIGDCVKQIPAIIASQIAVDEENDKLEIRVVSTKMLTAEEIGLVKNRFVLTVADAYLLNLSVVQVDKLYMTVGGKVPRVVKL